MQDRFRFRRWDKSKAKFMPVICIHPLLLQKIEERYVLMQCTGLKDKNGKLIYEDDIVKDTFGSIFKVYFNPHCLTYVLADKQNFIITLFDEKVALEVIGNIYENPELLESEE